MSDFKVNSIATKQGQHGPVIAGVSTVNSTGCMKIPSGPTEFRGGRDKGVFAGGYSPGYVNRMEFITISTTGSASDFGDLPKAQGQGAAVSSSTRGVIMGGQAPATHTEMYFITISSQGGANNFGDLKSLMQSNSGVSNNTRGVSCGGNLYVAPTNVKSNIMEFITIASTGDATNFGDLTVPRSHTSGTSSPTRGVLMGGVDPSVVVKVIDFITIATLGDALDFGELISTTYGASNGIISDGTRGFSAGGSTPSYTNVINQIIFQTLGNATDFGDLYVGNSGAGNLYPAGCSNKTKGIVAGGQTPSSKLDVIDVFTMASSGNATSFGALADARNLLSGFSDCHGGIG